MKHFDILAELISPPTPAVASAIESGLIALDAQHVDPDAATALMQKLSTNLPGSPTHAQAGVDIFNRLLALGGDPWEKMLPDLPNAATGALQQYCQGIVEISLRCPHPSLDGDLISDSTGRGQGGPASWLEFSARRGMRGVVKALLDEGMDPHRRTSDGSTLLHVASQYANIIPLLLEYGADPQALDQKGRLCVEVWSENPGVEYDEMLACVMDRGPGLDRFSLLRLAGGKLSSRKPLLEGMKDPKAMVDDQGRSIFYHMTAAFLDNRSYGQRTQRQVINGVKEVLTWRKNDAHLDPLDDGATRLLLWSARALSTQNGSSLATDLSFLEEKYHIQASDDYLSNEGALACLDAMVENRLLHDPSEIAGTALSGYWEAANSKSSSAMTNMLSYERGYPGLQWLERCFRGVKGGAWAQKKHEKARWSTPDTPIETYRKAFIGFVSQAPTDHPMWSEVDMGKSLIHLLRADWLGGENNYYSLNLNTLDDSRSAQLRNNHEPLMKKMDQRVMQEAMNDPVCHTVVWAMNGKNSPIQKLVAELEFHHMDNATGPAPSKPRAGPRL